MRRLIGPTEYVGLSTSGKSFPLSLPPLAAARDFSLGPTRSSRPRRSHRAPGSPVSPQPPAPHLRLLHGRIPESRVLLRPDSLPAFSRAAPRCTPRHVLSALTCPISTSFFRVPRWRYHSVCGLLRAQCTFLTRLSGRVFPFIPLAPSSAPPRIAAPFPFFFPPPPLFFSPFPPFFRGYRYKEHEATCALILTRLLQVRCAQCKLNEKMYRSRESN